MFSVLGGDGERGAAAAVLLRRARNFLISLPCNYLLLNLASAAAAAAAAANAADENICCWRPQTEDPNDQRGRTTRRENIDYEKRRSATRPNPDVNLEGHEFGWDERDGERCTGNVTFGRPR